MIEIFECEVCGNTNLKPFLDLGTQPLCDDLIPFGDESNVKKYPMLSEQYVDLDAQDEYYEDVIDAINRELFGVDCAPQG